MYRYPTGRQAAAIDKFTQEEIGIPGSVLMERAALKTAERITEIFQEKGFSKREGILVLVESGNNGGDGIATARLLHLKGYRVSVYEVHGIRHSTDSFLEQEKIAKKLSVDFCSEEDMNLALAGKSGFCMVLDAMFGIGLTRPLVGIHEALVEKINDSELYKVAVDIPSGLGATTGHIVTDESGHGVAVKCDETVTFQYIKYGMLFDSGREYSGKITCADIGIMSADEVLDMHSEQALAGDHLANVTHLEWTSSEIEKNLPARSPSSNKGSNGKILIFAGSEEIYGAAYFAAASAYNSGAGLVKVMTCPSNFERLSTMLPEVLLMDMEGDIDAAVSWSDLVLAGPGIGTGEKAKETLVQILKAKPKKLVLDADALNILAKDMNLLRDYVKERPNAKLIVTPHMMEAARLWQGLRSTDTNIPDEEGILEKNSGEVVGVLKEKRETFLEEMASHLHGVTILKDARTLVYPFMKDKFYVNTRGNSGLAKGGSGDVLSGIVAAFYSEMPEIFIHPAGENPEVPIDPMAGRAAALAVNRHACLADSLLNEKDIRSIQASDLVERMERRNNEIQSY